MVTADEGGKAARTEQVRRPAYAFMRFSTCDGWAKSPELFQAYFSGAEKSVGVVLVDSFSMGVLPLVVCIRTQSRESVCDGCTFFTYCLTTKN
jgi:hypothetical protein